MGWVEWALSDGAPASSAPGWAGVVPIGFNIRPGTTPGTATPPPPAPVAVSFPCSNCFFSIGFQILRRALVNQFLSCFLSMPVFCINMIWSCGVGYGCVKCSGDNSHALSVATAPVGSSRRDFPDRLGLPASSSSSPEPCPSFPPILIVSASVSFLSFTVVAFFFFFFFLLFAFVVDVLPFSWCSLSFPCCCCCCCCLCLWTFSKSFTRSGDDPTKLLRGTASLVLTNDSSDGLAGLVLCLLGVLLADRRQLWIIRSNYRRPSSSAWFDPLGFSVDQHKLVAELS